MTKDYAVFNERSIGSVAGGRYQAGGLMRGLLNVMGELIDLGCKRLRTHEAFTSEPVLGGYALADLLDELDHDEREILWRILQSPYLEESAHEDHYLECNVCEVAREQCDCADGLLCSHILEAIAVSFATHAHWLSHKVEIAFRRGSAEVFRHDVNHASSSDHILANLAWLIQQYADQDQLQPAHASPLPASSQFGSLIVKDWSTFRRECEELLPQERTARLRQMARTVAELNGYEVNAALSSTNRRAAGALRQIFSCNLPRNGDNLYLSTDFEKAAGVFEVYDHRGRHLGEWLFSGQKLSVADESGNHDIAV